MRALPNPWFNAQIERDTIHVDLRAYHKHTVARGETGYTMTRSDLVDFALNPRRWRNGSKDGDDTKATTFGSLVDCLALTPAKFTTLYTLPPEKYIDSKGKESDWTRQSKTCRKWEDDQEAQGVTVISAKELASAQLCVAALMREPEIRALIEASDCQVMITANYRDEATGLTIPFKFLLDLVPRLDTPYGKAIGDLKTTQSAEPNAWRKSVYYQKYHVQAAMYLDAYVAATGEDRTDFYHPVIESFFPYDASPRLCSLEFLELGRAFYLNALQRYAQCLHTGNWPGYTVAKTFGGWELTEPDERWMNE